MKETELKIRHFPDPVLRKKSAIVKHVSQEHRDILSKMSRAMYDGSGIGLAAPQVGISLCMIVVDIGSGLYKLINPVITKKQGRSMMEEGCLSVPEVCIKVGRAKNVTVEAQDENGSKVKIEAEGLLACVLQHEIDHLKARLIVDYASFLDKIKISSKLEALKKRYKNEGLPESKTKSCQLQL